MRESEEDLRAGDLAEFRRYADDLPLFVWMQRSDGAIDWANRTWLEFARLPHELALSTESLTNLIHPADRPLVLEAFERAITTRETYAIEHRLKPADADESEYRWVISRSTPRFAKDGGVSYWLGTAIDIHDSKKLAEQSLLSFQLIGDAVPQILWATTADGTIDWYNQRWYDYTGQTHEEAHGWGWQAVHHPEDLPRVLKSWTHSIATGTPFEFEFRLRGADGVFRWFLTRAVPQRAENGNITRWYGSNTDIDAEHRQRVRDAFFARVGEEMARALSLQDTLRAVVRLVTPEFADWTLISLTEPDGSVRLTETHHRDAAKDALAKTLLGRRYALETADTGVGSVMRTGRSVVFPAFTRAEMEANLESDVIDTFEEIGLASSISVAMMYGGKPVGRLGLVRGPGSPPFSAADVPLFEQLAARIAPAIGNAEMYERERRIATTFQRAAMTTLLPRIPGIVFDAIYEAGKAEAQVGGDWYDAFRLPDGRIVLAVGDVAGSGLEAAVTMSNVRQSIRTAAFINPEPMRILESADRIVRALDNDKFVTAFVGVLDPLHFELCYASAGHPPALLRDALGVTKVLDHGSLPLGLRQRSPARCSVATVEPGAMLVLYTDGLTEVDRDAIRGEASVIDAVGNIVDRQRAAREIFDAIMRDEGPHDDVAILTVSIETTSIDCDVSRWSFDVRDSVAANAIRQHLGSSLRARGLAEHEVADAELVLSELVANVVRYAVGEVRVTLDMTTDVPVLHVLDEGSGFEHNSRLPSDVMQENGRGLFIVSHVAEDLTISRRVAGGSHARAVIAGRIRHRDREGVPS